MANIVYIACSLDGYIARKDGGIDWLTEIPNPEQSDYGFTDFMERVDGIVMGRKTFELVQTFDPWPYGKPLFVLSRSQAEIPTALRGKAEYVHGPLTEVVESLRARGMKHLYIDGGKTIQSFLQLDLIDELIITRIPIILGSGIPLFAEMEREIRFALVNSEILNKDLVKNTYARKA
jgi:dihydrofolate reductase